MKRLIATAALTIGLAASAAATGLSGSTLSVRAGLDSIIVRGIDYPIVAIYALGADEARALTRGTTT